MKKANMFLQPSQIQRIVLHSPGPNRNIHTVAATKTEQKQKTPFYNRTKKERKNFGENKSDEFIHPIIENDSPWSKANSIYQAYTKIGIEII